MKMFRIGASVLALSVGSIIAAQAEFVSVTACEAAQAWDAKAGKCVQCKELVTDAAQLKSCQSCAAGTAFDIKAAKCEKVTVGKRDKPEATPQ